MKRTHLAVATALVTACCAVTVSAVRHADDSVRILPSKVQGVDYRSTLPSVPDNVTFVEPAEVRTSKPASQFTFDDIVYWAGEGSKRAALVVQWNCAGEETALVFGYRWDGEATGADLMKCVSSSHPRLYALMQYTNVSSPTDPDGGYTINGIGWDADEDGDIRLIDTGKGNQEYKPTAGNGFFEHPRGYKPGLGGSSDYDYDNWEAGDKEDFWQAGWTVKGFWSYWVGSSFTNLGFSNWGASGRVLNDGDVDGWNFEVGFRLEDWKPFEAAPDVIPADAKTKFVNEGLCYSLVNYQKHTVEVAAPFEGEAVYAGEVEIPQTFLDGDTEYTVVAVGTGAFANSAVTKVTLPSTVAAVKDEAFRNSDLASINLSDAVTAIGKYAFAESQLTDIYFPKEVTTIKEGAFQCTKITSLTIPDHVTALEARAFADSPDLTGLVLHKDIKTYGAEVFAGCDLLESVKIPALYPPSIGEEMFSGDAYAGATLEIPMDVETLYANSPGWNYFENVKTFAVEMKENEVFLLSGVTYNVNPAAEEELSSVKISYCKVDGMPNISSIKVANEAGYTGEVVVPSEITFQGKKYKVTELGDSAFLYSKATKITLPEGLKAIPANAFQYSKELTAVNIPSTVESIGESAFNNCSSLAEVSLPAAVKDIPQYAFNYCTSIKKINVASPIESLGMYAFKSCTALEELPPLAEGMEEIPQAAFQDCAALTSVKLPSSVKTLGNYVFMGCTNLVMEFPENVETMGVQMFQGCQSLTSMKVNDKVASLPNSTFKNCINLKEVEIPANVTTIGNEVFYNTAIEEMDIPETVTKMGTNTFRECKSLKRASIPAAITTIPGNTFRGCNRLEPVRIKNDKITKIDTYAFYSCAALTDIAFGEEEAPAPQAVRSTSKAAKAVKLPDTVKEIADYAFSKAYSLVLDPVMPAALTKYGQRAFEDMATLTEIVLPDGFTTFGSYGLTGTGVKELVVPAKMTAVASNAFNGLSQDTKVYFLSTTPPNAYSSSLTCASGKYPKIIVPSGAAEAYRNKNNYWKVAAPAEAALTVTFSEAQTKYESDILTLSSMITVGHEEDATLPERFTQADRSNFEAAKVALSYSKVRNAGEEDAPKALSDEALTADAEMIDGVASAVLTALEAGENYTGKWLYLLGDTRKESEPFIFSATDPASIASIAESLGKPVILVEEGALLIAGAAGERVIVADIQGKTIRDLVCPSGSESLRLSVPSGVYIVKVGEQSVKVLVK